MHVLADVSLFTKIAKKNRECCHTWFRIIHSNLTDAAVNAPFKNAN